MGFQAQLLTIYKTETFQGQKIASGFFFRQLWKLASVESTDPAIKEIDTKSYELSVERAYMALFLAFHALQSDPERLENPYICPQDGLKFSTRKLSNITNYVVIVQ